MRLRTLLLTLCLVGAFVLVTTRGHILPERLVRPFMATAPLYSGPDVAHGAGLSTDEQNNIDIYRTAHIATVNITSTVYKRYFFDIVPSSDIGSGFIINPEGQILTNAHVLQGSSKIVITLSDQSNYDGKVLIVDKLNDLALVKIEPRRKLPFLRLGDSDSLRVGQKVLAIGNPFGLEGTLTTGIVSSLGRTIRDQQNVSLEGLVQTDAAINPGNSGGPLMDSQGNVIGINTAIYGPNGNIGIGFAMPVNRAKVMLDAFRSGRKFVRPRLGVSVVPVAGDLAVALRLPESGGLLIQTVRPGTPAASAGLRGASETVVIGNAELGIGGDLIMSIDGKQVDREDAITRSLSQKQPGDMMELLIFRNGRQQKLSIRLTEASADTI